MTGDLTPEAIAKTEAMKDRLRACKTVAEVNALVKEIAPEVAAHEPNDPVGIIQVKNLAAYRRSCIERGWG